MRQALAIALVVLAASPRAWAADDDEEETSDEEGSDEEGSDEVAKPESKAAPAEDEDEETDDEGLPAKQNLTGHDIDAEKKDNEFERDRFFVDKVDTEKTEKGTLVQGSIASSSFFYGESGGGYTAQPGGTPLTDSPNPAPSRLSPGPRLQTAFRHIGGGRWEGRLDLRGRIVNSPDNASYGLDGMPTTLVPSEGNRIQAGLYGNNEYEVREAWLIRSGKRSDVYIGRQFIPDLGGLKIDGLRIDYAKSSKLTLIGFGGLMPVRGSRSIETDYPKLQDANGKSAGRFVAAGGLGGG